MWECVNALVGLRDVWWREVSCGIEKGRRGTAEGFPKDSRGLSGNWVKIKSLRLFIDGLCNVLILKWYVIAAKKA